jgi:predicted membrane chloride channel (bestrophin family)
MVVSFLLFGIEEIGVQIEEPFGILALEVSSVHSGCDA